MKKLLRLLFIVTLLLSAVCANGKSLGSYTMKVGETKTLYAEGLVGTTCVSTDWSTSNSSIVSIVYRSKSECTIMARAASTGSVTIKYEMCVRDSYYNTVTINNYYTITVSNGKITLSGSPNGGDVISGTKVTLTSDPASANIYYTLDGSIPTAYSTSYTSSGITIDKSCTLKAIAIKNGWTDSNVLSTTYKVTNDLTAKTIEGVEMKFKVTDAAAKTCEVAKDAISSLTSGAVTIPSVVSGFKVTSIAENAFLYRQSITSITIPNTVTSIGYQAFYDCSSLIAVTIPNSVASIGDLAFFSCSSLTSVTIPNSVTSIGTSAFEHCEALESVTLPSSLKRLEDYTFYYCTSLTSIKGFNNIEYIGSSVFSSTPWESNLPDGLNYIGKVLYKHKGKMPSGTKINIVDGCTHICDYAFYYKSGLEELNIPSSVVSIGNNAIYNCSSLKKITVDAKNPVYDSRNNCNAIIEKSTNTLLYGCTGTTIPSNVTSIGYSAFHGNITWEEIVIPNQIDSIADYAFANNSTVKNILIGRGLKKIGHNAFYYLSNLKEITVSGSNPYFDSRDNCNAIIEKATNKLVVGCSSTKIPNTVKVIGESAYLYIGSDNKDYTYIIIPNSVEEIQRYSFSGLQYLTNVTIGSNVKVISDYAFQDCKNIKSVVSLNGFPEDISEKAFDSDVYNNATLYVPAGCRNNYRLATGWSLFKNIVDGIPDAIDDVQQTLSESSSVYTPSGMRLSTPGKGLNIIKSKTSDGKVSQKTILVR